MAVCIACIRLYWIGPCPHCYKTECWIPLHSKDVSGLKSSWHGKCFLLLDRVNTCSRMDSSNHNGKLHWRILTQTGISHWLSFPKMEFSNDSYYKSIFPLVFCPLTGIFHFYPGFSHWTQLNIAVYKPKVQHCRIIHWRK